LESYRESVAAGCKDYQRFTMSDARKAVY
jgi:hypothetical protein